MADNKFQLTDGLAVFCGHHTSSISDDDFERVYSILLYDNMILLLETW